MDALPLPLDLLFHLLAHQPGMAGEGSKCLEWVRPRHQCGWGGDPGYSVNSFHGALCFSCLHEASLGLGECAGQCPDLPGMSHLL